MPKNKFDLTALAILLIPIISLLSPKANASYPTAVYQYTCSLKEQGGASHSVPFDIRTYSPPQLGLNEIQRETLPVWVRVSLDFDHYQSGTQPTGTFENNYYDFKSKDPVLTVKEFGAGRNFNVQDESQSASLHVENRTSSALDMTFEVKEGDTSKVIGGHCKLARSSGSPE